MALGALRKALYFAGRIDQKYNINKIFIQKYAPPHYRKRLNKLVDIGGTLGGGYGIYNAINTLIAPDTPGNENAKIPFQRQRDASYKSYKTRSGRARSNWRWCRPRKRPYQYKR